MIKPIRLSNWINRLFTRFEPSMYISKYQSSSAKVQHNEGDMHHIILSHQQVNTHYFSIILVFNKNKICSLNCCHSKISWNAWMTSALRRIRPSWMHTNKDVVGPRNVICQHPRSGHHLDSDLAVQRTAVTCSATLAPTAECSLLSSSASLPDNHCRSLFTATQRADRSSMQPLSTTAWSAQSVSQSRLHQRRVTVDLVVKIGNSARCDA